MSGDLSFEADEGPEDMVAFVLAQGLYRLLCCGLGLVCLRAFQLQRMQVYIFQGRTGGEDHASFEGMFELADITGPVVGLELGEGACTDARDLFADAAGEAVDEMIGEHGDVFFSFAQRWDHDGEYV